MVTAAVTIALAIGAGHLMQYGFADTARSDQPAPRPSSLRPRMPDSGRTDMMMHNPLLPPPSGSVSGGAVPRAPDATITPISFPARQLPPVVVPSDLSGLSDRGVLARAGAFGTVCAVEATASAAPGAIIRIDLEACDHGLPVSVSHAGLVFSARTDAKGRLIADIPAFEPEARVQVSVAGQKPIELDVSVPDAVWYDRVGLAWDGTAPLSIHALELGAGPGSAGHVSDAHPRGPERAEAAEGGFLQRLGEPTVTGAALAQVYSFPSGRITSQGTVRFSVSATVTDATCGQTIPVRILQSRAGDTPLERTVPVAFPGCESIGDILVLKNLLEDLKIARN